VVIGNTDYVENIDDFDINELKYKKYSIKDTFGFGVELFDDGKAILDDRGRIEICGWINGGISNILQIIQML
jgi:hypothetical protein